MIQSPLVPLVDAEIEWTEADCVEKELLSEVPETEALEEPEALALEELATVVGEAELVAAAVDAAGEEEELETGELEELEEPEDPVFKMLFAVIWSKRLLALSRDELLAGRGDELRASDKTSVVRGATVFTVVTGLALEADASAVLTLIVLAVVVD